MGKFINVCERLPRLPGQYRVKVDGPPYRAFAWWTGSRWMSRGRGVQVTQWFDLTAKG